MTTTQRQLAKRCRDCRQLKPHSAYGASTRSRDGHHSTCHTCRRTRSGGPVAGDPQRRRSIVNPPTWLDKYKATQ